MRARFTHFSLTWNETIQGGWKYFFKISMNFSHAIICLIYAPQALSKAEPFKTNAKYFQHGRGPLEFRTLSSIPFLFFSQSGPYSSLDIRMEGFLKNFLVAYLYGCTVTFWSIYGESRHNKALHYCIFFMHKQIQCTK